MMTKSFGLTLERMASHDPLLMKVREERPDLRAVDDLKFGRIEVILKTNAPTSLRGGIDGGRRVAGDE